MIKVHFPDFVGKSDQAVVMLVSSLDDKLNDVLERFHAGEQVAYRFKWNLEQEGAEDELVVLSLEFDRGEKVFIGLSVHHWDCLPSLISLGYLVLMTDPSLLSKSQTADKDEPRALIIQNAFLGLDELAAQATRQVKEGGGENAERLLKLLAEGSGDGGNRPH